MQVQSLGREDPLEEGMQPTQVFLPGEFHGQRSLAVHRVAKSQTHFLFLTFTETLLGKHCYFHFINEKTEAPKCQAGHMARKWPSWCLNLCQTGYRSLHWLSCFTNAGLVVLSKSHL